MKIFSIWERHKSRHKFGGTKVPKAEEVRKYFVNLKIVIRFFGYIICNLDFNTSCTLFLLHMKIVSFCGTYWLSISYFLLLCVCFVSSYFLNFFLSFFVSSINCWGIKVCLVILAWLNQPNQVQFEKNFSYTLPPLSSYNYLLQSIYVKLINQF